MEILDLYDRDRKKTGKTYLRHEKIPQGFYRLIVHLAIFNDRGQMLIQQRHPLKKMGGLWDISCGGAVDKGEDSRAGIQRELLEELGVSFDFSDTRPIFTANFKEGFDDFYMIKLNIDLSSIRLQEDEVIAVKRADLGEILRLMDKNQFVEYRKNFIRLIFDLNKDPKFLYM